MSPLSQFDAPAAPSSPLSDAPSDSAAASAAAPSSAVSPGVGQPAAAAPAPVSASSSRDARSTAAVAATPARVLRPRQATPSRGVTSSATAPAPAVASTVGPSTVRLLDGSTIELPRWLVRRPPDAEHWRLCEESLARAQANIARQDAASALGPPPTSRPTTPVSSAASRGPSVAPSSSSSQLRRPGRERSRRRAVPDYSDSEGEASAGPSKGKARASRGAGYSGEEEEEEEDELLGDVLAVPPPPPPPAPSRRSTRSRGGLSIPASYDAAAVPAYPEGEVHPDWMPPIQHAWTVCSQCCSSGSDEAEALEAIKTCALDPGVTHPAGHGGGHSGRYLAHCGPCDPRKRPCDFMMRCPTFPKTARGRVQARMYACKRWIWLEGGCVGERPKPDTRPEALTEEDFKRLFTAAEQEAFHEAWARGRGIDKDRYAGVAKAAKASRAGKEAPAAASSSVLGASSAVGDASRPAKRAKRSATPAAATTAAPVAAPSSSAANAPSTTVASSSSVSVAPPAPALPPTAVARRSSACGGLEAALDRLDEAAKEVMAASQVVNRELRGAGVPSSEVNTSAIPLLGALEEHSMALREATEKASVRLAGAANK
ncbi:uncharacterized protein PSFLO_05921 [Pseudozyma flocculosa]|uniref:Uncharacterized protein n=1 Tax=Pseudozyma flocculosa TaxID=84751 RepID=A0A5C3FAU5_9BASI|nr:uncharacterized protein PSFLO_05921 [Pseudozyma flocculosa]